MKRLFHNTQIFRFSYRVSVLIVCTLAVAIPASLRAGTVKHGLSSQTSWVGSPITLEIVFENARSHEAPAVPSAPGLHVSSGGTPSRSSSVSIINGHRTEQSALTYRFLIDASEPGEYKLPSFELHADDRTYEMAPVQLTFQATIDPSLIRAQITGTPSEAWIGDILPATLRILMKPFKDRQLPDGSMSAAAMWKQINFAESQWGPFHEAIVEMLEENKFPAMTIVRLDAQNETERWYAYDISSNIRLLSEGELDLSDVLIRMNYPVQIGRHSGSFFSPMSRLAIVSERPITASPGLVQVMVNTPPTHGRPATWSGAVGQFRFDVTASPTDVVVGEPITLTMQITDVADGPADLELLQAPKLDEDEALTTSFRVPDDRPGGVVSNRAKTFTQSIRPVSSDVTIIPPIPFAYFDPLTKKYDIAFSRPIDVSVTTSMQLDATSMGSPSQSGEVAAEEVTLVRGGLLANYTSPKLLLTQPSRPGIAWLAGIMVAPPLAFGLLAGIRSRRASDQRDPKRRRFRNAQRRFEERMSIAQSHPDAAAQAVRAYVADRFGLPEDAITSREAAAAVHDAGHSELAIILQSQLAELERMSYAGDTATTQEPPIQAVRDLVRRLGTDLR
ncbi:MAG: protein BatD [Planctomycetes bacterium]|jgi:hypothetical protein|nr:protein BatD [Planctomycetota bacterium]MCP4838736.1 protein BatD [Planctomycetota bacterium]